MRRNAGFAVFAILIAGLGVGASATVFSVVNTLLLRPLPFEKPSELVWIANRDLPDLSGQTTQVGYLLDLRERTQTLSAVAGYFAFYGVGDNLLSGRGEPERLSGVPVSENFFDVLGVKPLLGRAFTAQESAWNGPKAVMLGYALWERRFNRDPTIVGTSLVINDTPHTVVGVLPASFDFATIFAPGSRFDLYFPFPLSPETNRWGNTMAMIGRLKPGATAANAHAEVRVLAQLMSREHPERNGFEGIVKPLSQHVSGNIRLAVLVLAGAVGMVMLIVCANLSNLLLARTAARQKEIAIRMALGAGRKRLLAQMLTEGLVLSSGGAVLGLALAVASTRLLTQLDAVSIPLLRDVRTDVAALVFTVGVTLITGVVFGLAPALQASGAGMTGALKDASRGSTGGRKRAFGTQRAGGVGDSIRLRPARRRRPLDPQSRHRARSRDGLRPGAHVHDPGRSRQPSHAGSAPRVYGRRPAACRPGAGHRARGHHRHTALRAQSHLGRGGQRGDLRARQVPAGVRAAGQRRLPRSHGHPVPGRARLLGKRHGRHRNP